MRSRVLGNWTGNFKGNTSRVQQPEFTEPIHVDLSEFLLVKFPPDQLSPPEPFRSGEFDFPGKTIRKLQFRAEVAIIGSGQHE